MAGALGFGRRERRMREERDLCTPWLWLALYLLAGACIADLPSAAPQDNEVWVEVDQAHMDVNALTERGRQMLDLPDIDGNTRRPNISSFTTSRRSSRARSRAWRSSSTRISRRTCRARRDHVSGRSHIFIFRSEKRWKEFAETGGRRAGLDVLARRGHRHVSPAGGKHVVQRRRACARDNAPRHQPVL